MNKADVVQEAGAPCYHNFSAFPNCGGITFSPRKLCGGQDPSRDTTRYREYAASARCCFSIIEKSKFQNPSPTGVRLTPSHNVRLVLCKLRMDHLRVSGAGWTRTCRWRGRNSRSFGYRHRGRYQVSVIRIVGMPHTLGAGDGRGRHRWKRLR